MALNHPDYPSNLSWLSPTIEKKVAPPLVWWQQGFLRNRVLPLSIGKYDIHSIQRLIRAISQKNIATFHYNEKLRLPTFLDFCKIATQTILTEWWKSLIYFRDTYICITNKLSGWTWGFQICKDYFCSLTMAVVRIFQSGMSHFPMDGGSTS